MQPFCQHLYTIEKLFVFRQLVNAHVVDLHCDGKGVLVNAFLAAPVAAPGKVQDDVEGVVEGPLVVVFTKNGFLQVELFLAVNVGYDLIFCPKEGVDVEVSLGLFDGHGVVLVGVLGVVVILGVDG